MTDNVMGVAISIRDERERIRCELEEEVKSLEQRLREKEREKVGLGPQLIRNIS